MRLSKKRASSLVRRHGVPHVLHLLMRLWVSELAVIRGDVSHCMSMVSFLGKWLGNVLGLLHRPVSPGPCLISGWWPVAVVHVLQCGHTHCESQLRKQPQQPQQQPGFCSNCVASAQRRPEFLVEPQHGDRFRSPCDGEAPRGSKCMAADTARLTSSAPGKFTNWNDIEKIRHHTLHNELGAATDDHHVALTKAVPNSMAN